tara:strand:- start:20616 stop:20846 length:231 start_codon:yes stop_codon:yes gene_type:complete
MGVVVVPDKLGQCYAPGLQAFTQFMAEDEENMQITPHMCFHHAITTCPNPVRPRPPERRLKLFAVAESSRRSNQDK